MGSGRLEQSLKTLAHELGVENSVRFLGQVPNGRRYFKAFDLFALSSDHEPFGMVLLEAMAAGVPVIATNCGGAKEVVDNSDYLFELGDVAGLAQLLVKLKISSISNNVPGYFEDAEARQRFWQWFKGN